MLKKRITALVIVLIGVLAGFFVFGSQNHYVLHSKVPVWVQKYTFREGLDLKGGVHLVYRADVSKVPPAEVKNAMGNLRDVIERRINIFGVSEPVIQVQNGGFTNQGEERLIVDLPGVTNIDEAIKTIGQTPLLEFRIESPDAQTIDLSKQGTLSPDGTLTIDPTAFYNSQYKPTELTGRFLKHATLQFDQQTLEPIISIQFNDEGAKLFEKLTTENVGKTMAIFLDGSPISTPTVREPISGGVAQITGTFSPKDAKTLVGRLNSGALPVPVELISTQTIGPTLGAQATHAGVKAGMIAFLFIAAFFLIWYRLPGLIAVCALILYTFFTLLLFKLIPVTLTAAGIAGFIISIGIAVDANVLIFERIKEEMRKGETVHDAVRQGFSRAWVSIRDANISTLITAFILFFFSTSLIKGFALTLMIGVLLSLISAVSITRIFLLSMGFARNSKFASFLFGSGFTSAKNQSVNL
jgi:preprotein translocase subunit SecD